MINEGGRHEPNSYLTIRRADPKRELDGLMAESPVAE
jgi:hypothetical protein